MKQLFQTIAEVQKVETMAKGLKVVILTSELPPEQMSCIFGLIDKQGWFLFKESSIKPDEVKDLPDIENDGKKSLSQRLRAVIHVYWEQSGGLKRADGRTSEEYYKFYMEKMIDAVKQKLSA